MKFILFAFALFFSCTVFGQTYDPIYGKKFFKDSLKTRYKNNAALDSVLTTDTTGRIFLKKAASPSPYTLTKNATRDSIILTNGVVRNAVKDSIGTATDTTSISARINLKLNITDTANIRLRAIAGTNTTITGTYPNLTFNSSGGTTYTFTPPLINTGGVVSADTTKAQGKLATYNDVLTSSKWTQTGNDIINNNSGKVNVANNFQIGTDGGGVKFQTIAGYNGIWFNQAAPDFTNYAFLYDYGIATTQLNGANAVEIRVGNGYERSVKFNQNGETFFRGPTHINPIDAAIVPFSIQGVSAQSADLIKVNNSAGTNLFKLNNIGNLYVANLATGSTAPTTTGTTKMVITDVNGLQSFANIPSGGSSSGNDSGAYRSITAINDSAIVFNRLNGVLDTLIIGNPSTSLTGGSINWPGLLFNTPTTGTVSSNNLNFSPVLTSQSPYTVLGKGSGIGTPSFLSSLDSNWIPALHTESYYNTKYAAIGGGGSAGWSLTGNAGTNPSVNFLGTTDNTSLRLRTNNIERFVLDSLGNARFGTLTSTGSATPSYLSLGAIYGTGTEGLSANVRLAIYDGGVSNRYGFGLGTGQMEYITQGSYAHKFFINGTNRFSITTNGVNINGDIIISPATSYLTWGAGAGQGGVKLFDGGNTTTRVGMYYLNSATSNNGGMLLSSYGSFTGADILLSNGVDPSTATVANSTMAIFNVSKNVGIGGGSNDGTNKLQVAGSIKSTQYRLSALNTAPSSATDTGTLGEFRVTSTFIYVCTATNTWVRSALTTW